MSMEAEDIYFGGEEIKESFITDVGNKSSNDDGCFAKMLDENILEDVCDNELFENTGPRKNYIEWSEYFMAMALLASKRSKDPNTQVGACIVNKDNRIVGIGYNGMPNGCDDNEFPWTKSWKMFNSKLTYVCHAEMNAVLNKNCADISGCTIYVSLFPCNECAKIIIQAGIKEVIYLSGNKMHKPKFKASQRMFEAAGVKIKRYIVKTEKIEINFLE